MILVSAETKSARYSVRGLEGKAVETERDRVCSAAQMPKRSQSVFHEDTEHDDVPVERYVRKSLHVFINEETPMGKILGGKSTRVLI